MWNSSAAGTLPTFLTSFKWVRKASETAPLRMPDSKNSTSICDPLIENGM